MRALLANYRPKQSVTKLTFVCLQVESGHVESVMDEDIRSSAIEVQGRNMQ